jgi:hypothetical protein
MSRSGKFTIIDTKNSIDLSQLESKLQVFKPIDDDPTAEAALGFVCFDDYMQPVGYTPIQKGGFCAATLRIDVRKVPGSIFKKYFKVALEEEKQRTQRNAVSRGRKAELKEIVRAGLLAKTLPSFSLTDVVFDAETGRIYLCTASKRVVNYFFELMEEAFEGCGKNLSIVTARSIACSDDEEAGIKFLTWAFYRAHKSDECSLQPGNSVAMTSDSSKVSVVDATMHFQEALSGIAQQKGIVKASFELEVAEAACTISIDSDFCIGIKTPKIETKLEEGDEPDKPFYEKMFFVQKVVAEVESNVVLFKDDLESWGKFYPDVLVWASESEG